MGKSKLLVATASVALVAMACSLWLSLTQGKGASQLDRYMDGRLIPPGGLLVNPNGLEGLEHDVEADLQVLGRALIAHKKEKGQLPDDPRALIEFTRTWPEPERVREDHLGTQDHLKTDSAFERPEGAEDRARLSYQFLYRAALAIGPSARRIRERDGAELWIVAYEYVRSNRTVFRDGSQTTRPEGFYVALWSTGEVQRVPLTDEVVIPTGPNEWSARFRGEKGVSSTAPPANKPERTQWTGQPNE